MWPFPEKKITKDSAITESIDKIKEEGYLLFGTFSNLSEEFRKLLQTYEVQISVSTVDVYTGFCRRAGEISKMFWDDTFEIYSATRAGEELIGLIYDWKEETRDTSPDYPEKVSNLINIAEKTTIVIRKRLIEISDLSVQYTKFSKRLDRKKINMEKLKALIANL